MIDALDSNLTNRIYDAECNIRNNYHSLGGMINKLESDTNDRANERIKRIKDALKELQQKINRNSTDSYVDARIGLIS